MVYAGLRHCTGLVRAVRGSRTLKTRAGLPALLLGPGGGVHPTTAPPLPPPSVGGALVRGKIPTEAGDGVVLAYAIVPVWFTRFAVRARSKLGLTCECKTLGGGGGVALNTTLQVLSTLQGLTALQAFSSFLLFFRYIRDIRVNREPEGLRDL